MNIEEFYSKIFKRLDDPQVAYKFMTGVYTLDMYAKKIFPNKSLPKSLNYIYSSSMEIALKAIKNPENSVLVNIFFPCEILHAMDIYPFFLEGTSAFMAASYTEDKFIEAAEKYGIPETYCSFHKTFLGGIITNFFPKTKMAAATSLACDANVNTFRHIALINECESFILDTPYEYNEDNLNYIEEQIRELIKLLEKNFNRKMDEKKLIEILERENEGLQLEKQYIEKISKKYFPNTIGSEMARIFLTSVGAGTPEYLTHFKKLNEDIDNYPEEKPKKRIFWINLSPFNDESILEHLNQNKRFQFLGSDINFIASQELDTSNPYRALAKKLLLNHVNGPFSNKADKIKELVKTLKADGIIHMCQWGCKHSNGGALLLKKEFEKEGIPFMILDGDPGNNRNNTKGQTRTRLEAFLEILEKGE